MPIGTPAIVCVQPVSLVVGAVANIFNAMVWDSPPDFSQIGGNIENTLHGGDVIWSTHNSGIYDNSNTNTTLIYTGPAVNYNLHSVCVDPTGGSVLTVNITQNGNGILLAQPNPNATQDFPFTVLAGANTVLVVAADFFFNGGGLQTWHLTLTPA